MIIEKIRETTSKYSTKDAIIFGDYHISYSQLEEITNKLANGLKDAGINSGDRVALIMPNVPHFIFSYYAILKIGAIVVPINYMMEDDEFYEMLEKIKPDLIIYWDRFRHYIQSYIETTDKPPVTIVLGGKRSYDYADLVNLISHSEADFEAYQVGEDDTALVQFTSGVTEPPKGIELSHKNLVSSITECTSFFRFNESGVFGIVLPLFFIFSQNMQLNCALLNGGTVVLHSKVDYPRIAQSIDDNKISILGSSPNFYKSLVALDRDAISGASLKYCFSSWQPLAEELESSFEQRFGIPLLNSYSITETCGIVAANHPSFERKKGSVGLILPDIDIQVFDEQGQPLDHNKIGEVAIQGDLVMKQYWNNPETTSEQLKNGWFFTGDLGKIDDQGYLYLANKKADVIVKSGFPIYTREIEQILRTHPKVKEAVVLAIPHPDHKQDVKACIVLKENETATSTEIIDYCRAQVPVYKCPQRVSFYPSLPRTKMGRIFKRKLQENSFR